MMALSASLSRIYAIMLRNWFLYRRSGVRILNMLGWPMLDLLIWGFMNQYLSRQLGGTGVVMGALIGGVLLWQMFNRGQVGVMLTMMEEVWSRNLGQVFVTPIREYEYLIALLVVGCLHIVTCFIALAAVAWVAFGFSIFGLGAALAGFMALLVSASWWMGLIVSGLVIRYGQVAEWFTWMLPVALAPFVAIYYPVSALPEFLHPLSWSFPMTYVFEGMRGILNDGVFDAKLLWQGFVLNIVFLIGGGSFFMWALRDARRRGALLHMGE